MDGHYDVIVIVIGTGAGGGTLARHLAPSGKTDIPVAGCGHRAGTVRFGDHLLQRLG